MFLFQSSTVSNFLSSTVASGSCSCLTETESDVVFFCCCSPSTAEFNFLSSEMLFCLPWMYRVVIWVTLTFLSARTELEWSFSSDCLINKVFLPHWTDRFFFLAPFWVTSRENITPDQQFLKYTNSQPSTNNWSAYSVSAWFHAFIGSSSVPLRST